MSALPFPVLWGLCPCLDHFLGLPFPATYCLCPSPQAPILSFPSLQAPRVFLGATSSRDLVLLCSSQLSLLPALRSLICSLVSGLIFSTIACRFLIKKKKKSLGLCSRSAQHSVLPSPGPRNFPGESCLTGYPHGQDKEGALPSLGRWPKALLCAQFKGTRLDC